MTAIIDSKEVNTSNEDDITEQSQDDLAEIGYRGNRNLRKSGLQQSWTKKQLREYMKCKNDPIYFIKKYVKIVHIDKGIIPFKLWKFQEKLITDLHENRFVLGLWPRQQGKCLHNSIRINIRNKQTKEVVSLTIGEFYEMVHEQKKKK